MSVEPNSMQCSIPEALRFLASAAKTAEAHWMMAAADEIDRLREKCNSRTRWLQTCMRARYEQLTDAAKEFADALFAEELEPESEPPEVE